MKKLFNGCKAYYKKDKFKGVLFYLKMRSYNKFIKPLRFSTLHYFLSPQRIIHKRYEKEIKPINEDFKLFGNYYLFKPETIKKDPIVYSLGVLSDTSFDAAVSSFLDCNIYLFDPSIIATRHINKKNNPRFYFKEVAISDTSKKKEEFYTPKYGGSPSMAFKHPGQRFHAECLSLKDAMHIYNHKNIDIIKLDIEGAAPQVINHMLDEGVFPYQIIAEFERGKNKTTTEFVNFFYELNKLIKRLEEYKYSVYLLPRDKYKFYSTELIFVRKI